MIYGIQSQFWSKSFYPEIFNPPIILGKISVKTVQNILNNHAFYYYQTSFDLTFSKYGYDIHRNRDLIINPK